MRSSLAVNEIETRAAAAKMAYLSNSMSNLIDSSVGDNSIDSLRVGRDSVRLRALKFPDIKETSGELEMEGADHGSSETEPGSSETEAVGNVPRSPRPSCSLPPSTTYDQHEDSLCSFFDDARWLVLLGTK
jgi:hypothetical protein